MPKRTSTAEWKATRKRVLEAYPTCYWCGQAPSTEADHLHEHAAGGDDTEANLVGACKPCNSKRGAMYVNHKRTLQQQRRNEALGLVAATNVNKNR